MFGNGSIDWSASAAWAQAILSGLAIFAAVWLQDRGHKLAQRARDRERINALTTIVEHCVATLAQLNLRAQKGELTFGRFGFYEDETSADLAAVSAVDLSQIANPEVSTQVMKIRRLLTTARRRLARDKPVVEAGTPVPKGEFKALERQARTSLAELVRIRDSMK